MHSLVAVSQLYSVQETEVLLLSYAPLVIKCALDHTYIYLHIHSVLIGDSLDCVLCFDPYHCIIIYITLFIETEKFV